MDVATEISDGHSTMLEILQKRKLRLDASLTFWKKEDILQLVTFLLSADDDSLFNDVLPNLFKCVQEENAIGKKVTLGVCVELLPVLQRLLKTKYEDYIVTSLDFLRIMCHHWYFELQEFGKGQGDNKNQSMSLPPIYLELIKMQSTVKRLCRRAGKIGEKAKILLNILDELA